MREPGDDADAGPATAGEDLIEQIGKSIVAAIDEHLPYRATLIAAEPGRHLVAETAVMAATVLDREERAGEEWLYLDVGAYNGLMETQQAVGQWRFPLCPPVRTTVSSAHPLHHHRAHVRQLRHHVLRRRTTRHNGRGRPSLCGVGRRLHTELCLQLQRIPTSGCHRGRVHVPRMTPSVSKHAAQRVRRLMIAGWIDSVCLSFAWTLLLLEIFDRYGLRAAGLAGAACVVGHEHHRVDGLCRHAGGRHCTCRHPAGPVIGRGVHRCRLRTRLAAHRARRRAIADPAERSRARSDHCPVATVSATRRRSAVDGDRLSPHTAIRGSSGGDAWPLLRGHGRSSVAMAAVAFTIGSLTAPYVAGMFERRGANGPLGWIFCAVGMVLLWPLAPLGIPVLCAAQLLSGQFMTTLEGLLDASTAAQARGRVTGALARGTAGRALGSAAGTAALPFGLVAVGQSTLTGTLALALMGGGIVAAVASLRGNRFMANPILTVRDGRVAERHLLMPDHGGRRTQVRGKGRLPDQAGPPALDSSTMTGSPTRLLEAGIGDASARRRPDDDGEPAPPLRAARMTHLNDKPLQIPQ